jgi:hypothetical protein
MEKINILCNDGESNERPQFSFDLGPILPPMRWPDVQGSIDELNKKGRKEEKEYRLITEKEWEELLRDFINQDSLDYDIDDFSSFKEKLGLIYNFYWAKDSLMSKFSDYNTKINLGLTQEQLDSSKEGGSASVRRYIFEDGSKNENFGSLAAVVCVRK